MFLDDILNEFIEKKYQESVPEWLNNENLKSIIYKSQSFYKIRLACLNIDKKIYAESLVIYPNSYYESPIFGTEYVNIANKTFFGAIDFHPLKKDINYKKKYIDSYLESFPDRKNKKSKLYDLDNFFSSKLWVKKEKYNLIDEYKILVKCYLNQYIKCINDSKKLNENFTENHKKFNMHLGKNDPVIGILNSNFDKTFSTKYVREFLFEY